MADHDDPCDDCGQDHGPQPFGDFIEHIHGIIQGGRLVCQDNVRLRGFDHDLHLVGIAFDDGSVSFFALALDAELVEALTVPDQVCQACIDEQAEALLAGVDFDAPIPFLPHDHVDNDEANDNPKE